ncbi:hypothetical protein LJE71_11335 [Xanthobacter autotrophicus]|uniref:hypothetical protein n=1 Tax=Xanthobacter TaxID=279 RepID=UPI001E372FBD|nr:hypothetical protein [Xanthobacter autotrophicus]UDQ91543.1 hypothetical protein LJE71_11335 [Xanthobacter autotrophicus]
MSRSTVPTRAQGDLLRHIRSNGGIGMSAESDVGCQGAAFDRVFDAVSRRGWIEGQWGDPIDLTASGVAALKSISK